MTILCAIRPDADQLDVVVNSQSAVFETGELMEHAPKFIHNERLNMLGVGSGDARVVYIVMEYVKLMALEGMCPADVFEKAPSFLQEIWDAVNPVSECTLVLAGPVDGKLHAAGYRLSATDCELLDLSPGAGVFQPGQLPELRGERAPTDMDGLVALAEKMREHAPKTLGRGWAAGGNLEVLEIRADGFEATRINDADWAPAEAPDPVRLARQLVGFRFGAAA